MIEDRVYEMRMKGYCCSQIVLALGLSDMKRDNDDMIQASAGLCMGLWEGRVCGVFSGIACLISLISPAKAPRVIADMADWFESEFSSLECRDIVGENPLMKSEICYDMTAAAYEKLEEVLDIYRIEWKG